MEFNKGFISFMLCIALAFKDREGLRETAAKAGFWTDDERGILYACIQDEFKTQGPTDPNDGVRRMSRCLDQATDYMNQLLDHQLPTPPFEKTMTEGLKW